MDITSIRQALETTYQGNRELIGGLRDADLDRHTSNPRWRVRQLAAHIAGDDAGTLYVGKLLARGKNAKAPDFVVNLANWWWLRKYRRARPADLLTLMDAKHREFLAWLDTVTPEQLEGGGEISKMGRLTLAEFLVQNQQHSREHGDDIRDAIGHPLPREGTEPA